VRKACRTRDVCDSCTWSVVNVFSNVGAWEQAELSDPIDKQSVKVIDRQVRLHLFTVGLW